MTDGAIEHGQSSGWVHAMGITVVEASAERVVLTWLVDGRHLQPWGLVHGGVLSGAVETACSIGASLRTPAGMAAVGMENHTSFLRPVQRGRLRVEATPRHVGKSSQLWQSDVFDEQDRLVATGRLRLMSIRLSQPAAAEESES